MTPVDHPTGGLLSGHLQVHSISRSPLIASASNARC